MKGIDDLKCDIISWIMYHKIAGVIVTKLQNVNPELGKKESQEICAYGIEITLSTIVNYVLLIVIGMVFKNSIYNYSSLYWRISLYDIFTL